MTDRKDLGIQRRLLLFHSGIKCHSIGIQNFLVLKRANTVTRQIVLKDIQLKPEPSLHFFFCQQIFHCVVCWRSSVVYYSFCFLTSSSVFTDIDASAWFLLSINEVLHPVDVVEAQRDGGYEALQGDLNGQTKILFQQSAGQSSHCLWLLKIHPAKGKRITHYESRTTKSSAQSR